jgi:Ca2+/Na+ antiporter
MQVFEIANDLTLFNCVNLYREDSPKFFLENDLDVPCWDKSHYGWLLGLVLPASLFWTLLVPGIMFLVMRKANKRGKKVVYLSFLTNVYTKSNYSWEFVIMTRKFLLMFMVSFMRRYQNMRLYVAIYIFIAAYQIQLRYRPFESDMLNKLEELGIITLVTLTITGLIFLNDNNRAYIVLFGTLGAIAFILYVVYWIRVKREKNLLSKQSTIATSTGTQDHIVIESFETMKDNIPTSINSQDGLPKQSEIRVSKMVLRKNFDFGTRLNQPSKPRLPNLQKYF